MNNFPALINRLRIQVSSLSVLAEQFVVRDHPCKEIVPGCRRDILNENLSINKQIIVLIASDYEKTTENLGIR